MNQAPWYPHVTVATVVERDGRFLLVREIASGMEVINQPAGHLDPDETLFDAARRETLEETRWSVELQAFLGVYQYVGRENGVTYLRTSFAARPLREHREQPLDEGILEAVWLDIDEIRALDRSGGLRSPMVLRCIEDYLNRPHYPLELVNAVDTERR